MTARLKTNKFESINVSTIFATMDITQSRKPLENIKSKAETTSAAKINPSGLKSPLNSTFLLPLDSLFFLFPLVILAIMLI